MSSNYRQIVRHLFITALFFWASLGIVNGSTPSDSLQQRALYFFNAGQLDSCIRLAETVAEFEQAKTEANADVAISAEEVAEFWAKPIVAIGRKIRDEQPEQATHYFDYFLQRSLEKFGELSLVTAKMYAFLGESYLHQERLSRATTEFEKALTIYEKQGTNSRFAKLIFQKTGNIYTRLGNNEKALDYLFKARELAKNTDDQVRIAKVMCDINRVYINQLNFEGIASNAKQLLAADDLREGEKITLQIQLGEVLTEQGKLEEAITWLKKAETTVNEEPAYQTVLSNLNRILGKWHIFSQDYPTAEHYFNEALANETVSREAAKIFLNKAELFSETGEPQRAIGEVQQAIARLLSNENFAKGSANPLADDLIPEPLLFFALNAKAEALSSLGELELATQTYKLALESAEVTRRYYINEGSRLDFGVHSFPTINQALALTFRKCAKELQTNTPQSSMAELFELFEISKGSTLKESLQQTMALQSIPSGYFKANQLLREDITDLEIKVSNEQKQPNSEKITNQLGEQLEELIKLKRSRDTLHDFLQKRYPSYAELYKKKTTCGIDNMRDFLAKGSIFLTYFSGVDSVYGLAIWPTAEFSEPGIDAKAIGTKLHVFSKTALQKLLSTATVQFDRNRPIAELQQNTLQLYQLVVEPLLENIEPELNTINHLLVSPDGDLTRLPFAALMSTPNHYLLEDYTISYTVSASLLLNSSSEEKSIGRQNNVVAFSPFGANGPTNLDPLPFSDVEVARIRSLLGGKTYLGKKASKERLKEQAAHCKVLHLATHTEIDFENPALSGFWLRDGAKSAKLNAAEIYNLQLATDLVVLSACNSGVGRLQTGEGVLSLSRAFARAGSPATLLSLWPVDDESTSVLMEKFYIGLAAGKGKAKALRDAQLDYLKNADPIYQHPWYWSAFVLAGDSQPIDFSNSGQSALKGILGITLAILLIMALITRIYLRAKKRTNSSPKA